MTEQEYLAAWKAQIKSAPRIRDPAEAEIRLLGGEAIFGVTKPKQRYLSPSKLRQRAERRREQRRAIERRQYLKRKARDAARRQRPSFRARQRERLRELERVRRLRPSYRARRREQERLRLQRRKAS
jgi:hypothetical protein